MVSKSSGSNFRATSNGWLGHFTSTPNRQRYVLGRRMSESSTYQVFEADGRCAFTISSDWGLAERATQRETHDVAATLIHTCILGGEHSEGGVATGVGMC